MKWLAKGIKGLSLFSSIRACIRLTVRFISAFEEKIKQVQRLILPIYKLQLSLLKTSTNDNLKRPNILIFSYTSIRTQEYCCLIRLAAPFLFLST